MSEPSLFNCLPRASHLRIYHFISKSFHPAAVPNRHVLELWTISSGLKWQSVDYKLFSPPRNQLNQSLWDPANNKEVIRKLITWKEVPCSLQSSFLNKSTFLLNATQSLTKMMRCHHFSLLPSKAVVEPSMQCWPRRTLSEWSQSDLYGKEMLLLIWEMRNLVREHE